MNRIFGFVSMYSNVSFAYQKDEWRREAPPLIFANKNLGGGGHPPPLIFSVAIFVSQKFSSL
jgi:hypothetical protein